MDWTLAIDRNREALKRVVAMLAGMAEMGQPAGYGQSGAGGRQSGSAETAATARPSSDCRLPIANCRHHLPRHLYRFILRLLRPAELAARRLVIIAARGIAVTLPCWRPREPAPRPAFPAKGAAFVKPAEVAGPPPLTPPHKGEGDVSVAPDPQTISLSANASQSPSPLWGGVRGGGNGASGSGSGGGASSRVPGFPLFDSFRRRRVSRPRRNGVPRIWFLGGADPHPIRKPGPDDPIDATRLGQRLAALAGVLDDLPRQARRFARWQARLELALRAEREGSPTGRKPRIRRIWPIRTGRPRGWSGRHEVHELLNDTHALALWAMRKPPDTS